MPLLVTYADKMKSNGEMGSHCPISLDGEKNPKISLEKHYKGGFVKAFKNEVDPVHVEAKSS